MHLLLIHVGQARVPRGSERRERSPFACAAGFPGGQRRVCLPSWKEIITKPKTTGVAFLSGYLFWENSAFEAMEYSSEQLND